MNVMGTYLPLALARTTHFLPDFKDKHLRDFQLLAARFFLGLEENRGMLLFQDTGFGKTLTSVYILTMLKTLFYPHWKILILCKASLITRPWASTLMDYCKDLSNFHIIAYDDPTFSNKFFTYVNCITPKERVFVIIDECHNFISRNLTKDGAERKMKRVYNELISLVHNPKSKNKILLLSASPLVNSVNEFFLMIELLRPKVLTPDITLFKDNMLIYKDELVRGLQGICSYKRNLAFSIFDDIVATDGFAARKIKFKEVTMSPQQEKLYVQAEYYEKEKGLSSFKSVRRLVSAFCYNELPAKQDMTVEDYDKYLDRIRISFNMEFNDTIPNRGFTREGLELLKTGEPTDLSSADQNVYNSLFNYSAKYTVTCVDIIKSPGKCLLFEPFVKASGIGILIEYLKVFKISYIEFSGRTKSTRDQAIDQFNNISNIDGKTLKVCVFSLSGSEGVSYTGINDIYILDLTWNEASLQQIMGRAIRMGSHQMLDSSRWYTNVNFIICKKSKGTSVDQELLEVVKGKSRQIKQLFEVFRQCSIETLFERVNEENALPDNEDKLKAYLCEPIEFKTKTYKMGFVNVKTVYYSFDLILKNIHVGYIGDNIIYSEDGHIIGDVTKDTIIRIKNKKLIYVVAGC
ncbi:DEAD-like helicases superfamily D11 [Salmon gill poxvirus]|uniref:Nucleoside triphosphatase I n=1 Tax=Salmon gill poxvirus TaxID=1680908 RepID=A0A0H4Y1H3_9POXV|nr:DEAD-like helicases superfamily D11 [Salmon gill poxvirus]AKR04262.1 DEAD-like helicases superfamily D11 [Salmon gill poxvirus]